MKFIRIFYIFLICVLSLHSFGQSKECRFEKIDESTTITKNLLLSGVSPDLIVYICENTCINDIEGNNTDNIDYICLCEKNDCTWFAHRDRNRKSEGNKYIGTNSVWICDIGDQEKMFNTKGLLNDNAVKIYLSEVKYFCNSLIPNVTEGFYKYNNRFFADGESFVYKKYSDINRLGAYLYSSILISREENKNNEEMFYKIMSNSNYDEKEKIDLLQQQLDGKQINLKENDTAKNQISNKEQNYNIKDIKGKIENINDRILEVQNKLKTSVWKDKDGKFNKHRLLSDSIAGVVLGTAGGLITSTVMKKVQVKNGYEDIQCTINGQSVASYGDEFSVGRK